MTPRFKKSEPSVFVHLRRLSEQEFPQNFPTIFQWFMLTAIALSGFGCSSAGHRDCDNSELEVSVLLPKDELYVYTELNEKPPAGVTLSSGVAQFPIVLNRDQILWKNKNTLKVDFVIILNNGSDSNVEIFDIDNSWGYFNVKVVFSDGFHARTFSKRKRTWLGNVPSTTILPPGQKMEIPVSLDISIWEDLECLKKYSAEFPYVRVLFEQIPSTNDDVAWRGVWIGSVSSPYYSSRDLIARFSFPVPSPGLSSNLRVSPLGELIQVVPNP